MEIYELQQRWAEIFPGNPISRQQAAYWLGNYEPQVILDSIGVAVRKLRQLRERGEAMTLGRFCAFATGVMRNKSDQRGDEALPVPRDSR